MLSRLTFSVGLMAALIGQVVVLAAPGELKNHAPCSPHCHNRIPNLTEVDSSTHPSSGRSALRLNMDGGGVHYLPEVQAAKAATVNRN